MWDGSWHGGFFGPVMMTLLIALILLAVVLLGRWLIGAGNRHSGHSELGESPLDILKKRFAKGEIDKDEYEDRRKTLKE